ncbi:MAG TPA: hypothetical protein VHK90_01185 [Thermoanaerobaculia bacterium]|nr:hypothetical protein [Thermoanaerobaculia bacterium]
MSTKKKKKTASKQKKTRPGLPAKESVVEEKTFVSPKGKTYRIIRTTEVDEYEE